MRTPIRAAAGGVVVFSGTIAGGGNAVYINHIYVR
jgi:murein DD-endopeptidase MepM/ murein hydrolase activator NlpD